MVIQVGDQIEQELRRLAGHQGRALADSLAQYLSGFAPGITDVTTAVVTVPSATFSDGTISNGQVTQFVIVPEPATLTLVAAGLATAAASRWRARGRAGT